MPHASRPAPALHPAPVPGGADPLDGRARAILAAIVREHIEAGEPVGSHAIARLRSVDCSSATVRAVMADLEALGYLEKPHTSAGRVPTALGYHYYVGALVQLRPPGQAERSRIEKETLDAAAQPGGLLPSTSRLLHALTRHAGVVAAPRVRVERLQRIELLALREGRVLAICVTGSGTVRNRLLTLPPGQRVPTQAELEQSSSYLNQLLGDLTLEEARLRLEAELQRDRAELEDLQRRAEIAAAARRGPLEGQLLRAQALSLGALAVQPESTRRPEVHLDGQSSLLEEPALVQDLAKMRALFRVLDEKERVATLLDRALEAQELTLFIGAESGLSGPDLAVVAAPYRRAGRIVGALGVIGPTRMDYARVIPLVEFTAHSVGLALDPSQPGDDL